ncbi:DinB family protein [Motilibacter aurantiacus]|uniref:DinB family protein n=1 Tax=Motilibacter aurantiacus TaxID=2714955 RepID=UPI002F2B909D
MGGDSAAPGGAGQAVPGSWAVDLRGRLEELLDGYREALLASLDGLTEEEARLRLVPSRTTLLGLLKHVTFVEAVWFGQAVTGRPLRELGVASTPDRSFTLHASDTIASVQAAYRARCAESRAALAVLPLDARVSGRGDRDVWALVLQVLRELAQHAGHADILREQVLARRDS